MQGAGPYFQWQDFKKFTIVGLPMGWSDCLPSHGQVCSTHVPTGPPRSLIGVIGIGLLILNLALSSTGYLLPWDQLLIGEIIQ